MEKISELHKRFSIGRTFRILPILDLYIFREFLIPFTVLTFTFTLLFLIGDVFRDLSEFIEYKASPVTTAQYFILKMPGNIRFILPISVLLSCMYTVANLGRTREITAMRASGISMLRCGGVIFVVSLFVTGINFWFNEQLVPDCDMNAKIIYKSLEHKNYSLEMYNMLQYRSSDKMRNWLIQKIEFVENKDSGIQEIVLQNVLLKQYKLLKTANFGGSKNTRHIIWDLAAQQVYSRDSGWLFKNVVITRYNEYIHIPGPPEKYQEVFIPHNGKIDLERSHGLRQTIPETLYNIQNAIKPPEELSSMAIFRILRTNTSMVPSIKNIYKTYLYYRLAFPWVCFLCVFLGLPLAVKNERSGIFLSIVTAVAAIVVFQVLTEIFLICGKQGIVPPCVGGLGPILLFLIYSYWFVIRKSA